MTKLVLILFLAGLQNPPPASGIKESQPPENKAEGKQANSAVTNTVAKRFPIVLNNNPPSSNDGADDAAQKANEKSPQEWWTPDVIMAFTSIFMVLVGIGQLVMYLLQWRIMRKSLAQVARISRKQMKHATESSERSLRAYVGIISSHEARGETGLKIKKFPFFYTTFIKNFGQTPAYKVVSAFGWRYFEGSNVDWPEDIPFVHAEIPKDKTGSAATLGSGQIIDAMYGLDPHEERTFADIYERLQEGEVTIYFYGTIAYEDVYGRAQITTFCEVSHDTATEGNFVTYRKNNEAT